MLITANQELINGAVSKFNGRWKSSSRESLESRSPFLPQPSKQLSMVEIFQSSEKHKLL